MKLVDGEAKVSVYYGCREGKRVTQRDRFIKGTTETQLEDPNNLHDTLLIEIPDG